MLVYTREKKAHAFIVLIVLVWYGFIHSTCSMTRLLDAKRMLCHLRQADTFNKRGYLLLYSVLYAKSQTNKKTQQNAKTEKGHF